jgi:hypothetical protein
MAARPTRFPSGLTNASPGQALANAGFPDPGFYHAWWDDFDLGGAAVATLYLQTLVGTGATALSQTEDGGVLVLSTTAGAADANTLHAGGRYFFQPLTPVKPGKKEFFKCRLAPLTANGVTVYAGLMDNVPGSQGNGLYFRVANGVITLRSMNASVNTDLVLSPTIVPNLASGVLTELAWEFDGVKTVKAYVNAGTGALPGTSPRAKGPVAQFTPTLTTAGLFLIFGAVNSTAVANGMEIDYVLCAKER